MRPSRVLKKMRKGAVASCTKMNLADPCVAEIVGRSGLDCLWTCLEHVPNTLRDVEEYVRATKLHDVDLLVRVERGSYSDLVRPLEVDATGIMVPHVMSAAEARQVAWQTKFHPVGRRPIDGGNADGDYGMEKVARYLKEANEERFVVVQIEDPEAMDELDEIVRVPGIDMIFFGPGDFSHALGVAGELDEPRVEAARRKVAECARKAGKFAGTVAAPADLPRLRDLGYQFISIGSDVRALASYFVDLAAVFGATPRET